MPKQRVWFIGGDDVRFRLPLLLALRRRGFEVAAAGSEASDPFQAAGVEYHRYRLARGLNPAADVGTLRELTALFAAHRPDVVQAFDTKPTILAPLAAERAGVPARVCTITGMGHVFSSASAAARALRPVYRWLQAWSGRHADVTVFQNEDDRAYFLRHGMVRPGHDRLVRGSGIDLEDVAAAQPGPEALEALRRELGLEGKLTVLLVARLVVEKGIREYIQAARQVRAREPKAEFLLVGPAESEGTRAVPAEEIRAASDAVRWLGPRRDVPALLAASDLFVLPTYYREGVPRVLLEAGVAGLPLVATDMPGCRDVVKDGWNGLLVPPRDPGPLAEAVLRLLASPADRSRMGERSRAHVMEHFSLERVADGYADLYRDLRGRVRG
ncbi:MAG TPA: glycosyltransferase family 4 protein [Candidatus Polarisedimenticolia bacterium]|nr:glycosyltransferase family 4 protein [Candidatus Polarisedimenticolia bacterium]